MRWTEFDMRRSAVGIIALVMLGVAAYGGLFYDGFRNSEYVFFWSSCLRIGLVLGAVWFALPQLLERKINASPLVLTLFVTIALVIIVRPRAILLLWPILIILGIIQFFRWLVQPPAKNK
jgi:hypothetical protein